MMVSLLFTYSLCGTLQGETYIYETTSLRLTFNNCDFYNTITIRDILSVPTTPAPPACSIVPTSTTLNPGDIRTINGTSTACPCEIELQVTRIVYIEL